METPPAHQVALDVLGSLLEGCQVIGFDWRYLYVNDTVVTQAKRSRDELIGRTMQDCYPGIDQTPMFAMLRRCMTERKHERLENEFRFPDGSIGWFELRFIPVPEGTCVLSLDITEAKRTAQTLARTEEQVRQLQKMEAIGRLAGGVAHDFNNLLSVIISYASLNLDGLDPESALRADLQEILTAGERASDLTRQLLAFSRHQVLEPKIVDLNDLVAGMEKMVRRLVGEDILVRTALSKAPARVKADPGQIEQVVMNLVVNARDAMPDGGRLTIETQNVHLDADYAAAHVGTTAGPHVMLAVSDTGTGMDKATQERIFEPFFTTKEIGKGTGLGLSTVFGIVRRCGGSIWVYSEPGHGATFKLYLPCTDALTTGERPPVPVTSVDGTETLLLVEDDDQLRAVARGILTRRGYQVLDARSGADALARYERHQGPLDLLLTDVVMPAMSGRELAERIAAVRPSLRVLFMSGYTENAMQSHFVLPPGAAVLQKPITPDALLRKVREVLNAPVERQSE